MQVGNGQGEVADTLLLKTLLRKPTDKVPLWLMRQAGRYLPEYLELREEAGSFLALCKTPGLACRATVQPIERFGMDAAILFSDILVVPDALGCDLVFVEGEGPLLQRPVRTESDVAALGDLDPGDISYQADAIRLCKSELPKDVPLIGFAGAPFTLSCYMVDGKGGEFLQTRKMMHADPKSYARLIDTLTKAVATCLLSQAKAGADVLMVFDSWAGLVPRMLAGDYLISPLAKIVAALREEGCAKPVIAFQRGASDIAELAAGTGVAALGVDWQSDFADLGDRVGGKVALQGNLDPAVLLSDPATTRREALRILNEHRHPSGHVFNLGHGINKDTPIGNVEALVETVKGFRREA